MSQPLIGSNVSPGGRQSTSTWSLGGLVRLTPSRGQDPVRVLAVGDDGGHLFQVDRAVLVALDRAHAGPHVATDAELGRCRGEQQLALRQFRQVVPEESRLAVVHDAGDLNLMHREDHGGRRAVLAELEHHVGHLPDRRAEASQVAWGRERRGATRRATLDRLSRETGRARSTSAAATPATFSPIPSAWRDKVSPRPSGANCTISPPRPRTRSIRQGPP